MPGRITKIQLTQSTVEQYCTTSTMVHLAGIKTDSEVRQETPDITGLQLGPADANDQDLATANVYGSSFSANQMPMHEMPEGEMPPRIAYRMIKLVISWS